MEQSEQIQYHEIQTKNYIQENGRIYLAFGWVIHNINGRITERHSCPNGELYACISVELPAFFRMCYYKSLQAGFGKPVNEQAVLLPEAFWQMRLHSLDMNIDQWKVSDHSRRGICVTIKSQGYTTDRIIYMYKFRDQVLYVAMDELYGLGLLRIRINKEEQNAIVSCYDQRQLLVLIDTYEKAIRERLTKLQPEEVIRLWIRGQQLRSGALQYLLFTDSLKLRVMQEIKFRGWITGGMSPTLNRGRIQVKYIKTDDKDHRSYDITYHSMVMGKVYQQLHHTVTLYEQRQGEEAVWLIDSVQGDIGYYTYKNISS